MKNNANRKNQLLLVTAGSILSMGMATSANAEGLFKETEKVFDHFDVKVGAWANGGITYNDNEPDNRFNGPVTFADRASEFQLNQLNLYIQKAVAAEGSSWDFGGRFDIMYGSDSIFTQAYGVPAFDVNTGQALQRNNWDLDFLGSNSNRFYDLALPQAYLETYVPVGNGLNLKIGHFYTPIGYETVPAPDNFFYTHAYTMQYGEPFTHTGIMGNYTLNDNWAFMGGLTTGSATGGWDGGWDRQMGNWSGLMGTTWTSNDKDTSLNIAGTYGDTSETSNATWALYSIVLKHNITPKTHFVLQHDHGFADSTFNFTTLTPNSVDASWYGINSHLYYDVSDTVVAGLRAEWFRDQNGLRVCSPGRVAAATDNKGFSYAAAGNFLATCAPATYYQITAGVTWKPKTWLSLRPNVRYDWVEDSNGYSPFTSGSKSTTDQVLFSTDFTVTF
ncbi:porin [Methylosoma difficile]